MLSANGSATCGQIMNQTTQHLASHATLTHSQFQHHHAHAGAAHHSASIRPVGRLDASMLPSSITARRHRRRHAALALLLLLPSATLGFLFPSPTTSVAARGHFAQQPQSAGSSLLRLRAQELAEPSGLSPQQEQQQQQRYRQVALVKRFARLPFWPIWHGLVIMLLDQVGLKDWSEALEAKIGGRVSPMIFLPGGGGAAEEEEEGGEGRGLVARTDPFLMNVHHRHSFHAWDPFRAIQARFFPEGFPAHPHSGFCTLTYVLQGSMKHRDSMGVKQVYGDGGAQFLTAGSGVLHEEMWYLDGSGLYQDMELFQLWINLPRDKKGMAPSIQLAGDDDDGQSPSSSSSKGPIPVVTVPSPSSSASTTTVRVVMGEAHGVRSPIQPWSPMSVLHCTCEPGARWECPVPAGHSLTLYVRRGPLDVVVSDGGGGRVVRLATYETAFFKRDVDGADLLVVQSPTGTAGGHKDGADFLVMAGQPLREPILASGPFVESDAQELQRAYARYQMGAFGQPWDHSLSDEEWRRLCAAGAGAGAAPGKEGRLD